MFWRRRIWRGWLSIFGKRFSKAGRKSFSRTGSKKASLRVICKKAGLTTGAFYAGAFGAIYIVLMLIVVLATSAIPILYIVAPFTVGVVCATVYELCVLKERKFGPALILGVLFALVACSGNILGMVLAMAAALLAELIILAERYRSKKLFLLSFLAFNLNMVCPGVRLYLRRLNYFIYGD